MRYQAALRPDKKNAPLILNYFNQLEKMLPMSVFVIQGRRESFLRAALFPVWIYVSYACFQLKIQDL